MDLRHTILISPTGALEKDMATHSIILAWRISWTEEPGGLLWDCHGIAKSRTRLSDQHLLTLKEGNNELEDWFEEITRNALWRDKEIEDRKEKVMFNSCLIPTPERRE